jgi:hypothetical protein
MPVAPVARAPTAQPLSFKPAPPPKTNMPPGALVPGQRPDKALNRDQFHAAQQARSDAAAQGLTGRAKDVFVANAVMKVQ